MTLLRSMTFLSIISGAAASTAGAQSPYLMTQQQNMLNNFQAAGRNPGLYGSGMNPYAPSVSALTNPYAGGGGVVGPNAFTNPYSPFFNPLSGFGAGSVLYGEAELLRGYSTVIISQEQSRILREQALQAKIDTARRRFDFDLYVRANTPTFADEQKKVARNTLKRIQSSSNPVEIVSGKSLNILLDDVRTFPLKKANLENPIQLSDDVLKQLNVTTRNAGVGLLRNNGKFVWPVALTDLVPVDQRRALEKQVQIVVANAAAGKVDVQVLADINLRMDEIKKDLAKKINDIPSGKYLEADRFLSDFREARQGIEEGQMAVQDKFTRFIQGGKSMQEVADYLVANGLRFAPAAAGDEAGYRALHSALVNFDVALNTGAPASESEKQ